LFGCDHTIRRAPIILHRVGMPHQFGMLNVTPLGGQENLRQYIANHFTPSNFGRHEEGMHEKVGIQSNYKFAVMSATTNLQ